MSEQTVFGVPRVPAGMLERPALLERIGRSPLTVIRAPGGSGKTVLMAQWASAARLPGIWITVEPDAGDRLAFWGAVASAAAHSGRDLGIPTLQDGGDREALRGALVRAFRAVVGTFVLVVDDLHELRDPLVVDDLLAILHACRGFVVVAGTRSRSELEAPRQALTLDIGLIEPEEMVLTTAEIELLVGDRGSRLGTPAELLDASGGNPLLLRAIVAGSSTGAREDAPSAVVRDHLRALFAHEGAEFAAFASSTAVPDDVDTALAEHLSGLPRERVEGMLASLESDGLLMRRETPDGARHRYHPLVREVLREELQREQPDRYRRASLLASAAAETQHRYLPALRHAVDAEDYLRASDVCLHGGMSLLRSRGAAAILQRVPLRYVARLPFIAIVLALAANARGERFKALELMTLALGASRASRGRQRAAERVGLALVETVVLRISGRAADSMAAARRMATLLDEAPAAELEEIADQTSAFRMQGALSLFRGGRLSEARIAAERAGASEHALRERRSDALGAASLIAAVDAIRGEVRSASQTLSQIDRSDFPVGQRDGYVGALAHLARGIVLLEDGDPDGAEAAIADMAGRPNLEHGILFAVVGSLVWLWRERPQIGLRSLDEREGVDRPRARVSREDRTALATSRVLLHAALGEMGAAHEVLRGLDRGNPVAAVLEAQVLLLEQRPELVVERIGQASELPGPRLRAAGDLLVACAALLIGDAGVADAAMRRFLAADTVHGVTSPFLLMPEAHRPALLELAERIGADAATVARLAAIPAPFPLGGMRVALTRREADVLDALRTTARQVEIAAALGVSQNTVKSQLRTLYRKLGVSDRDAALRAAYLQGLLRAPGSGVAAASSPPNEGGLNRG